MVRRKGVEPLHHVWSTRRLPLNLSNAGKVSARSVKGLASPTLPLEHLLLPAADQTAYCPKMVECDETATSLGVFSGMTTPIVKTCLNCQKSFEAHIRDVNRGRAKYCCIKCSSQHLGLARKGKLPSNVKCAICDKTFRMKPSRIRSNKSGHFFCCRAHKDIGQRLESNLAGVQIYNKLRKPDGERGSRSYRRWAIASHGARCDACGYDKHPEILEAHHIDENRRNNHPDNLRMLCRNCHAETHFLAGTGQWKPRNKIMSS